jgi:D-glycero-beta-D-manno-heptose 1-phosphate adenylyltransferase
MKFAQSLSEKHRDFEKALKQKIIPNELLAEKVNQLKAKGLKIATLNGSFDLLHAGHLYILFEAKKQADILIVAVNSDASIKKYKSENRPIIDLENRMKMLASLEWVDFVTSFDETDPIKILKIIKPHIHVNGAEYGENCIEKQAVIEGGGKLYLVDRIPGLATSEIIKKIKGLCD